ncbi:glycosyltransferase family 21 protein [Tothia fuscella]|uniref:Ceramide glucosyltransferase n=1 Tax=Tothia fuscella TaxID=1048955 RepID=A0A9P4NI35_9PEZI|nr:glycosyltransferase family 21 protein [Tothia fuscella]
MVADVVAAISLFWGSLVVLVSSLGYFQIQRHFSSVKPISSLDVGDDEVARSETPHVTIIRPVKGLDPGLYECLASTFRQTYPSTHLTIYFCISDRSDPALPILERLIKDFPSCNTRIFVEDEDPHLQHTSDNARGKDALGPNPKVRSMSRAYREAKGGLLWIIDCNVWVAKGVCGRMVERLLGWGPSRRPQKLVHQLPLVVDTEIESSPEMKGLLRSAHVHSGEDVASTSTHVMEAKGMGGKSIWNSKGGRMEELFMSSSHAKFYTAINTVLVAPCLVGKSNMFRRSHLNALTDGKGIDYFSNNICEDHLIGDLLWKRAVPPEVIGNAKVKWGNHAILFGDLAIQPMANMSVKEYLARRVRWLRVRKYTVTLATLVEATTESFFCSAMLSYGLTYHPYFRFIPATLTSFILVWLVCITLWATVDWTLYRKLHSAVSIDVDENTPAFARPSKGRGNERKFSEWVLAWLGREALAFPIWFWACFGGATVTWRGRKFWVDMGMVVHEIGFSQSAANGESDGVLDRRKIRRD